MTTKMKHVKIFHILLWGVFFLIISVVHCDKNPSGLEQSSVTGLDFPGSEAVSQTMRFAFSNPQDNALPAWGPGGRGVTYIWKVYPRQQYGYYTTFFWGNMGTFLYSDNITYYGFHPYPNGSGNTHKWEIAGGKGADIVTDDGDVMYDTWYTQVARVWSDSNGKNHEYYWDWPDTLKVVTFTASTSYGNNNPPVPALTWGDAPWPNSSGCVFGECGEGAEVFDGILRGIQIYNNKLSISDIQSEIENPLSTSAGASNIWYLNINPTPSDISDKSGKNHNPSWVGSERPALYTSAKM